MSIPERARRFVGRLIISSVLGWRSLQPGTRTLLFWVVAVVGAILAILSLPGCHAVAPVRVELPSVQPVQQAVVTARQSNAKAVDLARIAESAGIAAGSASAHALTAATANTENALAEAEVRAEKFSAAQSAAQLVVDKQTTQLAAVVAERDKARVDLHWYRVRFWPLVIGLALAALGLGTAVACWVLARFTGWGARTFGPYILGAEKLAAKVAVAA